MRKAVVIGALALAGCHTWTPLAYQDFRYVGMPDPDGRTSTMAADADPGEGAFLRDDAICIPPRGVYPGPWGYAIRNRNVQRYLACMAEKGWVRKSDK
jgi:hypothetical protein